MSLFGRATEPAIGRAETARFFRLQFEGQVSHLLLVDHARSAGWRFEFQAVRPYLNGACEVLLDSSPHASLDPAVTVRAADLTPGAREGLDQLGVRVPDDEAISLARLWIETRGRFRARDDANMDQMAEAARGDGDPSRLGPDTLDEFIAGAYEVICPAHGDACVTAALWHDQQNEAPRDGFRDELRTRAFVDLAKASVARPDLDAFNAVAEQMPPLLRLDQTRPRLNARKVSLYLRAQVSNLLYEAPACFYVAARRALDTADRVCAFAPEDLIKADDAREAFRRARRILISLRRGRAFVVLDPRDALADREYGAVVRHLQDAGVTFEPVSLRGTGPRLVE